MRMCDVLIAAKQETVEPMEGEETILRKMRRLTDYYDIHKEIGRRVPGRRSKIKKHGRTMRNMVEHKRRFQALIMQCDTFL